MIDKTKNLCYIVTVHFHIKNGAGVIKPMTHTFISLHGIMTEKCEMFAKNRARANKQFHSFSEDLLTQYTVPLKDYCK